MKSVFLPRNPNRKYRIEPIPASYFNGAETGFGVQVISRDRQEDAILSLKQAMRASGAELAGTIELADGPFFGFTMPDNPEHAALRLDWTKDQLRTELNQIDIENDAVVQKRFERFLRPEEATIFAPEILGSNLHGATVRQTAFGRVFALNGEVHSEWQRHRDGQLKGDNGRASLFLRAKEDQDWDFIARTLIGELNRNSVVQFSNRDLEATMEIASADGGLAIDMTDFRERIEAQVTFVRSHGHISGRAIAATLSTGFPNHSVKSGRKHDLAQFSTPPAIGEVAAQFLAPNGKRILEPTIGNGVLAAAVAGAGGQVVGIELDERRAARAAGNLAGSEVRVGNALDAANYPADPVDGVLANPPFKALAGGPQRIAMAPFPDGGAFPAKKAEAAILAHSINSLKAGGNAVFVMPAEMLDPSMLSGEKVQIQNMLAASFEEVKTIALDAKLYQAMGSNFPVLVHFCRNRFADGAGRSPADAARYTGEQFAAPASRQFQDFGDDRARLFIPTASSFAAFYDFADAEVLSVPTQDRVAELTEDRPDAPQAAVPRSDERERPPAPSEGAGRSSGGQGQGGRGDVPESASEAPDQTPESEAEAPATPAWDDLDTSSWARPNWFVDDLSTDEFTTPYIPMSRNERGARTVIERTMASGTSAALQKVAMNIEGDVDDFVASKLGIEKSVILDKDGPLSPEQIDSLALSFYRRDQGRATILGDQMGVGKGRQLAAHALNALKVQKRPVLFMTNRENLFTDFAVRDLADVSGQSFEDMLKSDGEDGLFRPFIMNANSSLKDGERVVFKTSPEEQKDAKSAESLVGYDLVMMSYSQVQIANGAWRARAIKDWITKCNEAGTPPLLLLDEVHKAAGPDSRTGFVLRDIIDHAVANGAGDIVYSSATSVKSGKNLPLYAPALPDTGLTNEELMLTIENMPLAVQEILSAEMARSGSLIERKMSDAGVERDLVKLSDFNPDKMQKARELADRVAPFLQEMQAMVPEIREAAKAQFRSMAGGHASAGSTDKLQVDVTAPATQLDAFSRYLVGAVKGLYVEDMMIDAVVNNNKSTVVCEFTGDSVAEWLVQKHGGGLALEDEGETSALSGDREVEVGSHPNIGHVLERFAERMLEIKGTNAFGDITSFRIEGFDGWLEGLKDDIARSGLDDLRINIFDRVRQVGEELGQTVEDISGRKIEFVERDGKVFARRRSIPNSIDAASRYNTGKTDVLCFNSSAATGISLQNSPRNGSDLRRRVMIKLAFQREITDERQVEGRINRTGQLSPPRYMIPVTGFAADDRIANLFNRANRNLTSSTSATRDNKTNAKHTVDILNPVGEMAVRSVLERHPDVADRLGIDPEGTDLARKLLGRSIMLSLEDQSAILGDVDTAFHLFDEKLTAEGRNPLKLGRYDWKANVTEEKVLLEGNPHSESIAAQPLTLNKVTFKEEVSFRSPDAIEKQVRESVLKEAAEGGFRSLEDVYGYRKAFDRGAPDLKHKLFDDVMGRASDEFRRVWPVEIPEEVGTDLLWRLQRSLRANRKRGANYNDPFTSDDVKAASEDVATQLVGDKVSETADFFRSQVTKDGKPVFKDFNYPLAIRSLHRQVSKVEQLGKVSELLQPGAIIAIDRRAVASRIAGVFSSAFEDVAAESGYIPAVVTNVRFPSNAPFAESKMSISIIVPGSSGTESITLSSMRTALEAAGDEAAVPVHHYSVFANQLVGADAAIQSNLSYRMTPEYEAMEKLFGRNGLEHVAQSLRDIELDVKGVSNGFGKPNLVTDNLQIDPGASRILRAVFDGLPKQAVTRSRYTLEGNMFAGMSAITARSGNALGEKVIYTDSDGNTRNAILLNNKGTKEIIAQVEAKATQRATPLPSTLKDAQDIGDYFAAAAAIVYDRESAIEQMWPPSKDGGLDRALGLGAGVDLPVQSAAGTVHAIRAVASNVDRTFPLSLSVGGDPWAWQAEQYRKQAAKSGRHTRMPDPGTSSVTYSGQPGEREGRVPPSVRHDDTSVRQILNNIQADQLVVLHSGPARATVVFKKTHPLLKEGGPVGDKLRDGSFDRFSFFYEDMSLTKGVLALDIALHEPSGRHELGEIIKAAAIPHRGEILACGMTRDVNAAVRTMADGASLAHKRNNAELTAQSALRELDALSEDVKASLLLIEKSQNVSEASSDKAGAISQPENNQTARAASSALSGPSGPGR